MWPYKTYTLLHIVANDENQSTSIKNTLENDTRCKSLRPSSVTIQTVYIRIKKESEINVIQVEYNLKFTGCTLTFSLPMDIVLLPNDKLRFKKLEVPSIYTGIVYGSSVVGILGTSYTQGNITPELIITAFASPILPAIGTFFMKLQKIFEK